MFVAELYDFKIVCNVLKSLLFKEFGIIRPMQEGLKITVEEMRSIETSIYIPSELFKTYNITTEDDIKFKISLKIFAECLQIFGEDSNPILKMSYKGTAHPFSLIIINVEDNVTVDCEINTLSVTDSTEICLAQECNLNKMVIDAEQFADLLSNLDVDADELELIMSPEYPNLKLKASGIMSNSFVEISKESDPVMVFQCEEEIRSSYAFSNVRQILKVLSLSKKVQISTGSSGLLGMQLLISRDEGDMFVEYYVTPLHDASD